MSYNYYNCILGNIDYRHMDQLKGYSHNRTEGGVLKNNDISLN